MRMTGADVKSWTENRTAAQLMAAAGGPGGAANGGGGAARRPCRVVVVEGEEGAVLHAVNVIVAAVDRYKDLCEGKYQGGQEYNRKSRLHCARCDCVACSPLGRTVPEPVLGNPVLHQSWHLEPSRYVSLPYSHRIVGTELH